MSLNALTAHIRQWLNSQTSNYTLSTDVVEWARPRRMLGFLYHTRARMSDSDLVICEQAWAQNSAFHLLRLKALEKVWSPDWPPPLLFKGADFIENLYGDPGARQCADLDILVPTAAFPMINESLSKSYPVRLNQNSRGIRSDRPHQCSIEVGGALLEVHAYPAPPFLCSDWVNAIYQRSTLTEIDGLSVAYPTPMDRLRLWLVNQMKTGFIDGPFALIDFALILRSLHNSDLADWSRIRSEMKIAGLEAPLELAIALLHAWDICPSSFLPTPRLIGRVTYYFGINANAPVVLPNRLRCEALKLWLCPPNRRLGWLTRTLFSLIARDRFVP